MANSYGLPRCRERRQTQCAGEIFHELIVNTTLDGALSGAGVFNLDGVLVGFVANCDNGYHIVSVADIEPMLKAFETPERKIESSFGFHIAELNADTKNLFRTDSGLFVTEVRIEGPAGQAGLQAGGSGSRQRRDNLLCAGKTFGMPSDPAMPVRGPSRLCATAGNSPSRCPLSLRRNKQEGPPRRWECACFRRLMLQRFFT